MKNQRGFTIMEYVSVVALISGSYALTADFMQETQKAVDDFVQLQNKQKQQICKIRPSMCEGLEK